MAITGNVREQIEYEKKVGLFEGKVVAINPDKEDLEKLFPSWDPEKIKDPEYLSESDEGKAKMRVVIYVQDVKTKGIFAINFFLEDKLVAVSKKTGFNQQVSSQGKTYWGDPDNMPEWFNPRDNDEKDDKDPTKVKFHKARKGEADLLEFLNSWLNIERKGPYSIEVDWQQLMKGSVRELRDLMNGSLPQTVVCMAYIRIKQEDGAEGEEPTIQEWQSVYTRKFLPGYHLRFLRTAKLTPYEIGRLRKQPKRDLKPWQRYVLDITDEEYGLKDFYGTSIKELHDYVPADNPATQKDAVISAKETQEDDPDYE